MEMKSSSKVHPDLESNISTENGARPPSYDDAVNHNEISPKDKESVDTIETLNDDKKDAEDKDSEEKEKGGFRQMLSDIDGDKLHVLVLFFLYILQGIPLGLASSVPLVLQERGVAYRDQAVFSFASYPFSMKILWAPIVDSIFIKKFGRRKSWLIPTQLLIGIIMLILSQFVDVLLGPDPGRIASNENHNTTGITENVTDITGSEASTNQTELLSSSVEPGFKPDVLSLTIAFFFLKFFAATQDVAVDGWALTMLKPKNVGYAATCNSAGQTTGWCLGYILYTVLDDANVIDLGQFLLFWGIVFLVTTTFIGIFKKEENQAVIAEGDETAQEPDLGIIESYKIIWKILCHPLVPSLLAFLLTSAIGFTAAESITSLKLITAGVPKGRIARVSIWMIPVKIGMTVIISRFTVGPRPMNVWLYCYPLRILLALAYMVFVYVTPLFKLDELDEFGNKLDDPYPDSYYVLMIFIAAFHRAVLYGQFVAIMAFFARISDPAVGGTNMTFFNTFANLGNMWTTSFVLWFVDIITYKDCSPEADSLPNPTVILNNSTTLNGNYTISEDNYCYGDDQEKACKDAGGSCDTTTDGYYILCLAGAAIGSVWFIWAWRTIRRLQKVDVLDWRVTRKEINSGWIDNIVKKITGLKDKQTKTNKD